MTGWHGRVTAQPPLPVVDTICEVQFMLPDSLWHQTRHFLKLHHCPAASLPFLLPLVSQKHCLNSLQLLKNTHFRALVLRNPTEDKLMAKSDYTELIVFPLMFLLNPVTKGRGKDKRRGCDSIISVFTMADWQAAEGTFKLNMEKFSIVLGNKPVQCPSPKKWIFLVILKPSCAFWHGLTFAPWSGSSILWYQTANFKHCWSQKKMSHSSDNRSCRKGRWCRRLGLLLAILQ